MAQDQTGTPRDISQAFSSSSGNSAPNAGASTASTKEVHSLDQAFEKLKAGGHDFEKSELHPESVLTNRASKALSEAKSHATLEDDIFSHTKGNKSISTDEITRLVEEKKSLEETIKHSKELGIDTNYEEKELAKVKDNIGEKVSKVSTRMGDHVAKWNDAKKAITESSNDQVRKAQEILDKRLNELDKQRDKALKGEKDLGKIKEIKTASLDARKAAMGEHKELVKQIRDAHNEHLELHADRIKEINGITKELHRDTGIKIDLGKATSEASTSAEKAIGALEKYSARGGMTKAATWIGGLALGAAMYDALFGSREKDPQTGEEQSHAGRNTALGVLGAGGLWNGLMRDLNAKELGNLAKEASHIRV